VLCNTNNTIPIIAKPNNVGITAGFLLNTCVASFIFTIALPVTLYAKTIYIIANKAIVVAQIRVIIKIVLLVKTPHALIRPTMQPLYAARVEFRLLKTHQLTF